MTVSMMAKTKPPDPKIESLRQRACLNPRPERVQDPLFAEGGFFDSRDLVQVRYEMVRRVRIEGQTVSDTAAAFGVSRPAFYHAQLELEQGGLANLVPKKRGPRGSHKLSPEVVAFLRSELAREPALRAPDLAGRIQKRFGFKVHPRSVERALAQRKKKAP